MRLAVVLFLALLTLLKAEQVELRVMQTSDVHGALFQEDARRPSWLKLATLISAQVNDAKTGSCLLIDCGDTIEGSPVCSRTQGAAGMLPIIQLPYDVWVPGNHEMDFGIEAYIKACELAGDRLLCANLQVQNQTPPKPWRMFQRNGANIAVIGISASYFKHWLLPDTLRLCRIETAMEALHRIMPDILGQKPDAIILAIHQAWLEHEDPRGVNEVNRILQQFPEIDIILGGHTHRTFPGQKVGANSWYMQPGAHGQYLAVAKVIVDTEAHKVLDVTSRLLEVKEDTPEDPELARALDSLRQEEMQIQNSYTGVVMQSEVSSYGKPGSGCQTSDLLCQAIADAVGADVVLHGKLSETSLYKGRLKAKVLHWLVPYDNTIVTLRVTAEQLEAIFVEQWKNRSSYRFNGPWNAVFSLTEEGVPKLLSIAGKAPEPGRKYLLAMNSHAAAGSGTSPVLRAILENPEAQLQNHPVLTRDALLDFLKKCGGAPVFHGKWVLGKR